ncbi:hypothetical protein WN51_00968 [Melipona quadrifasciata]|uniref:Cytochrome c oxidase subunit 7A1, mitochondrial n=1 Tax=Melipona quadrifasciata TaxID=166423 RepID=A0A0M8ZW18_9HYME|nr:hypothetical protein WN51_00968 [Melipona quadrifasciata]
MSFHQFSKFTGRLKQATQLQALYPLSPRPLEKIEAPKLMFDTIKTKVASTSLSKQHYSTIPSKMKKFQQEWQASNEPTYLLRGSSDKLIYYFSVVTCVIGTVVNLYYTSQLLKKFK